MGLLSSFLLSDISSRTLCPDRICNPPPPMALPPAGFGAVLLPLGVCEPLPVWAGPHVPFVGRAQSKANVAQGRRGAYPFSFRVVAQLVLVSPVVQVHQVGPASVVHPEEPNPVVVSRRWSSG